MPDPRVRRKARECALEFLFSLEFTKSPWDEALEPFWQLRPTRMSARSYAMELIQGICAHREDLDRQIAAALQHWSPERVGRVEWTLLRMALFEMRHMPDVPEAVAMNEAIELAKNYGAEDAPRFINGVLDRLGKNPPQEDAGGQERTDDGESVP